MTFSSVEVRMRVLHAIRINTLRETVLFNKELHISRN